MKGLAKWELALIVAVLSGVFQFVFVVVFQQYEIFCGRPILGLILSFFGFISTLLACLYIIDVFIYKKLEKMSNAFSNLNIPVGKNKREYSSNLLEKLESHIVNISAKKDEELEELKKLEQYRREFLGNVSHELKTPIFNIQGYVETLLDGGLEDKNVNKTYLEKASRNLDRLSSIVEDLLQISQYESGKLVIEEEKFDIQKAVTDVFESLTYQANQKKIQLKFKDGSSHCIFVLADKIRITQVLNNLISNAIKYGRVGGGVFVGLVLLNEKLKVEITDDGLGIAAEHLPRLFERFYRVDKMRSRESGGTGLGLSIVKHIMEAHGEQVSVESKVGVGSSFYFTLKLS
jgi:two-component system phosphate regulon sensor histidine kinase PhoR